jgi:thioredoxin 1
MTNFEKIQTHIFNMHTHHPFTSAVFRFYLFSILAFSLSCKGGFTDGVKTSLSAIEFNDQLNKTPNAQILDVRTPEEFEGGHLGNALNIDYNGADFNDRISKLPKDKPVFVYCLSGGRSSAAAAEMRKMGFSPVYEMEGGMMKWRASGLPEQTMTGKNDTGMNEDQYKNLIPANKDVLIDFYAEWCQPCKKMKPWLDELSEKHAEKITVIRIDADKNASLCKTLGVTALPVLKYYSNGKEEWSNTGFIGRDDAFKKLGVK